MRLALTILLCKVLRIVLKIFGRGSSMPGKICLKLYPNVLSKIKMPKYVIAVTGSNGKTSTVEMIRQILINDGFTIACNSEGSNQIDGVATLVLNNSSLVGKFQKDILLIETDERYAKYTFKYFSPTHFLITNLYRDQMTRNGNPEFVLKEIKKAISSECKLVLNSDDPLISSLSENNKVYYYGINDSKYAKKENDFNYDDGYYCPKCRGKLTYKYHQFGHIGDYRCKKCGFERKKPNYYISKIDLKKGYITINNKYTIRLAFNSIYNAYNLLAAYSIGCLIGTNPNKIVSSLNEYLIENGRIKQFKLRPYRGTLLISKHENSVAYNKNIDYILSTNNTCDVVVIVDSISRKYYTSETSWLWDINFELLNNKNIKRVILSGTYAFDLVERLNYTNINKNSIYINTNIHETVEYIRNNCKEHIFVLTCFSDENKFIKEVDTVW